MIKGITAEEQKVIQKLLSPYKNEFEFYYYGSRVKGNFEKMSDLDILIKGECEMPFDKLELIKYLFDNSDIPYIVNFTDFNKIDTRFFNLIKKDLVKVL